MRSTVVKTPRTVRGSMFLWFTLVALPFMLLAGMFSADFASGVLAKEEARALADAAATAGAWQISTTGVSPQLRCGTTANSVQTVATKFVQDNASLTLKSATLSGQPTVTCNTAANSVSVQVNYTMQSSAFYRTLMTLFGGSTTSAQGSVTRTAIICVPGSAPTVGGSCTRPDNDF